MSCVSFLVVLASGCGSDVYQVADVTGSVTCIGNPAVGGYVIFEPIDAPDQTGRPPGQPGGTSRGMVQEDGSFTLVMDAKGSEPERHGALVGPHRVSFVPPRTKPVEWDPRDDTLPEEEKQELKDKLASYQVFEPLECGNEITPNQVEVEAGADNVFVFSLSDQPKSSQPSIRQAGYD